MNLTTTRPQCTVIDSVRAVLSKVCAMFYWLATIFLAAFGIF